jgi:hypothetical protein
MKLTRRSLLAASAGLLAMPRVARAATVVDAAGRSVTIPWRVERVFPAGPPAAITHYTPQHWNKPAIRSECRNVFWSLKNFACGTLYARVRVGMMRALKRN